MSNRLELDPDREPRIVSSDQLNEICTHALDVAPEECCGLIVGSEEKPLARVVRITNVMTKMHVADPSAFPRDARHAYYMSEVEYLRAIEEAEAREEEVMAVYHSHFGQGCYLSEDDLAFASHPLFPFPNAAQIVVSVLADSVQAVGIFEPNTSGTGAPFVGRLLKASS
ncbi:MAG: Mov34/MPN/PAD-1 family protein [Myxococcota bacterium]